LHFVAALHHLAWTQYPAIFLCESFAILWLVLRSVRSRFVQGGVLLMLCGLMLNALVTDANAGHMPVVGMPSTIRPANATWQAATPNTQLAFLADQARLGLFSLGDLVLLLGGFLILAICLRRILRTMLGWLRPEERLRTVVRGTQRPASEERSPRFTRQLLWLRGFTLW
jgi:hypothetical protein